jgi:hypothetical protein
MNKNKAIPAAMEIAFVKPPFYAPAKSTDRMFLQIPFYHKTVLFALVLFLYSFLGW